MGNNLLQNSKTDLISGMWSQMHSPMEAKWKHRKNNCYLTHCFQRQWKLKNLTNDSESHFQSGWTLLKDFTATLQFLSKKLLQCIPCTVTIIEGFKMKNQILFTYFTRIRLYCACICTNLDNRFKICICQGHQWRFSLECFKTLF